MPGLECIHQGKVRDTYVIPEYPELLLMVATDRVSTHNIVHLSEVPMKGYALTALTSFWMTTVLEGDRTHLVAHGKVIYDYLPEQVYPADLHRRAIVVTKLDMLPIEFVFRSRMAGSLWKDYYKKGIQNPYGLDLPPGLELMSPFNKVLFTPTDKSETDEPLDAAKTKVKYEIAAQCALDAYVDGRAFAATKGIEIIDGKFEIGIDPEGYFTIGDECLTPDSCRFVNADGVKVGTEPAWLDKEYLRAEAERMWAGGKKHPLTFSPEAIEETTRRYEEIVYRLSRTTLATMNF